MAQARTLNAIGQLKGGDGINATEEGGGASPGVQPGTGTGVPGGGGPPSLRVSGGGAVTGGGAGPPALRKAAAKVAEPGQLTEKEKEVVVQELGDWVAAEERTWEEVLAAVKRQEKTDIAALLATWNRPVRGNLLTLRKEKLLEDLKTHLEGLCTGAGPGGRGGPGTGASGAGAGGADSLDETDRLVLATSLGDWADETLQEGKWTSLVPELKKQSKERPAELLRTWNQLPAGNLNTITKDTLGGAVKAYMEETAHRTRGTKPPST